MSKAFTRESDDASDLPEVPRPVSPLPPGAKNYLTPEGAGRLRDELDRLLTARHSISAAAEDADVKRQLQALDQRINHVQHSLSTAVIVNPPSPPRDQVLFGASVTVRNRAGAEERYRIVGVDETDIEEGRVSWLSPIARALLNARPGQRVRFRFPSGEDELEIVAISYS